MCVLGHIDYFAVRCGDPEMTGQQAGPRTDRLAQESDAISHSHEGQDREELAVCSWTKKRALWPARPPAGLVARPVARLPMGTADWDHVGSTASGRCWLPPA